MKKTITLLSAIFIVCSVFAQKEVVSAYNANKEGKYEAAAGYIDKAILNEKAATKEKTWRYRGNIYLNIARDSVLFIKYPDAIKTAMDSYVKAKELDTKEAYKTEIFAGLDNCQVMAGNTGINLYSSGDYLGAAKNFGYSNDVAMIFDAVDSMAIYNQALAFEKGGASAEAIATYEKCASMNYRTPDVYFFIMGIHEANGDTAAMESVLATARKAHPDNQDLIIRELNVYLEAGKYDEAEQNLLLAAEKDPSNAAIHYSLGFVYDNLKKEEEAVAAYQKAIDINPEYFDANYNIGVMYFNKGVEIVQEANEVPPNQNKRYQTLMDDARELFDQAKPFMEKAHEIDGTDRATIQSLRDIYLRTGDDEKMLKMSELLKK